MGGKSTTEEQKQSVTNPWKPAQPALKGILGGVQPMIDNAGLTANESGALDQTIALARAGNPYAPALDSFATTALAGGPDRTGLLSDAYARYQDQLGGTARGDYLDPNRNPFFGQMTQTMGNDIQSRINGMFAGAGRDLSGANMGTLARGLTEGLAPVFAQQYDAERARQIAAQNALYSAGGQTAAGLAGLDAQRFNTQAMGAQAAQSALSAQNWENEQILAAEAARRGIPLDQFRQLTSIVAPIAGLGQQSSSTSTGSQQMSGAQQFNLIATGLGSLFPKPPSPGQIAAAGGGG
jgi:hypothetical protein